MFVDGRSKLRPHKTRKQSALVAIFTKSRVTPKFAFRRVTSVPCPCAPYAPSILYLVGNGVAHRCHVKNARLKPKQHVTTTEKQIACLQACKIGKIFRWWMCCVCVRRCRTTLSCSLKELQIANILIKARQLDSSV